MYEAKIAAGTDTGQGPYTETWARAITRPGNCHGMLREFLCVIVIVVQLAQLF